MLPVGCIVLGFFMKNLLISSADLLTEAKYAEQLSLKPEKGPDLMAYVWGGIELGGVLALLAVGPLLQYWGLKVPYQLAVFPAAFILWPVLQGYLGERRRTTEEVRESR